MRLKDINATCGETRRVVNEWAAEAEARNTTISSSTWTAYGAISVSSPSLSGTTASASIAVTGTGCLTNTVLLANGETLVARRQVRV